jgi:uncharacterized protein YggL (DUF469 family)
VLGVAAAAGDQHRHIESLHEVNGLTMAPHRQVETSQPVIGQRIRSCQAKHAGTSGT